MIDMSNPIGPTPLDLPGGLLGQPLDRVDGPLKVTGQATYAYEYRDTGQPTYGFVVVSSIGKGRITAIDTEAAGKAPGVLLVLTHTNAPQQGARSSGAVPQLADDRVLFHGQPVALVVAETFEQARAAAYLVKPSYARNPAPTTSRRAAPEPQFLSRATAIRPTAARAMSRRPSRLRRSSSTSPTPRHRRPMR
jgi:xanthine dehydrogenase YagR molybdenum-binding subunit